MLRFLTFLLKFQVVTGCHLKCEDDILILHFVSLMQFLGPDTGVEEVFLSCPIGLGML